MARVALSCVEVWRAANSFGATIHKVGTMDVYWYNERRRICTRSIARPSGRNVVSAPEGAVYVGRYARPCSITDFMRDLDAFLDAQGEGD